jgi:hypothetical protein
MIKGFLDCSKIACLLGLSAGETEPRNFPCAQAYTPRQLGWLLFSHLFAVFVALGPVLLGRNFRCTAL